jgi:uncharacterized protein (TIGR03435 family)
VLNWRTVIALGLASLAFGQTEATPAFDVVSVKVHTTGAPSGMFPSPGRVTIGNRTLKGLLCEVYRLREYQVVGDEGWMKTISYDIVGKASGPANFTQMLAMVKTMLADRFDLRFHRDTRQLRGYWLVIGKNGSRLLRPDPNDTTRAGISNRGHFIQGWKEPVSRLVDFLGGEIQIPLTDKTGLDGVFDFKLEWAEEARPPGSDVLPDEEKPSLFSAIQEQLGLKLEVHSGPVEMFVIDHAAKPTEN